MRCYSTTRISSPATPLSLQKPKNHAALAASFSHVAANDDTAQAERNRSSHSKRLDDSNPKGLSCCDFVTKYRRNVCFSFDYGQF